MKQTQKIPSANASAPNGLPNGDEELVSKTKLKAEADALQALGVRLCELTKDKLVKLNLPEALYTAVIDSKKITANGATRRHKQYLGKLMRDIDPTEIEEQLSRWDGKNLAENAYFHGLERWRDRLINEPEALALFMASYPNTESQSIRTLIRNAQKEQINNKPPKSSRELFKLLREITSPTTDLPIEDRINVAFSHSIKTW